MMELLNEKPSRDRDLVEAAIGRIDRNALKHAIVSVFGRYRIRQPRLENWEMPSYVIRSARVRNHMTGNLVCGAADAKKRIFRLYLPGLALRRARGFNLRLAVLEIVMHENIHLLEDVLEYIGVFSGFGPDIPCTIECLGYARYVIFKHGEGLYSEPVHIGYSLVSEGVVQSLALEVLEAYLRATDFRHLGEKAAMEHLARTRECGTKGAIYPEAVEFIRLLSKKLGEHLGTEEEARGLLYRGLIECRSLQDDPELSEAFRKADVSGMIAQSRYATSAHLGLFNLLLNSPWMGVEAKTLEKLKL